MEQQHTQRAAASVRRRFTVYSMYVCMYAMPVCESVVAVFVVAFAFAFACACVDSEGRNIATLLVQTSERERSFVPKLEFNFVVRSRKRGNGNDKNNNNDDEK